MPDYSKLTNEELIDERAKIDAEFARRFLSDTTDGCCNRMPCQLTACPRQFIGRTR